MREDHLRCLMCAVQFETELEYEEHNRSHLTEDGHWICPFCDENGGMFKFKGWLIQHIWKFHSEKHSEMRIKSVDANKECCKFCLKILDSKEALEKHLLLHENLSCQLCNKRFSFPYQLKNHMAIHGVESRFKCKICQDEFKLKRYLQKHMKDVHHYQPSKTHVGPRCNICEPTVHFLSLEDVFVHAMEEHKDKLEENVKVVNKDDVDVFVCKQCFKTYSTHQEYVTHVVCHTRKIPLMCETCGKYFDHKTKLKVHQ